MILLPHCTIERKTWIFSFLRIFRTLTFVMVHKIKVFILDWVSKHRGLVSFLKTLRVSNLLSQPWVYLLGFDHVALLKIITHADCNWGNTRRYWWVHPNCNEQWTPFWNLHCFKYSKLLGYFEIIWFDASCFGVYLLLNFELSIQNNTAGIEMFWEYFR